MGAKEPDMDRIRWLAEIGGEGSVAAVELRWLLAEYDKLREALKELEVAAREHVFGSEDHRTGSRFDAALEAARKALGG